MVRKILDMDLFPVFNSLSGGHEPVEAARALVRMPLAQAEIIRGKGDADFLATTAGDKGYLFFSHSGSLPQQWRRMKDNRISPWGLGREPKP
jgi:hypothetical protein